ncbi:MAG: DNA repair protein RecN [Pseudomonadota bacterium]
MLQSLSIRDIVLIQSLDLDLANGLSVLTGETGAGKSILLDALALALGARGDGGLVRKGCEKGEVRAVFEVPKPEPEGLKSLLADQGIEHEGELLLRRTQNADGRTKATVNDLPVSVASLRALGTQLVEIHGQHDDRALVDPEAHRALLTVFGGLEGKAADVADAFAKMRAEERKLKALQAEIAKAEEERDYLTASVEELSQLAPELGEEEALASRRSTMMAAEKIASELQAANEELTGSAGPTPIIAHVIRRLERKAETMPDFLPAVIEALDAALRHLDDASTHLDGALRETEFSPQELESAEERLFALRAAARKYSVAVENLPDLTVRMADDLSQLNAGTERLEAFELGAAEARSRYDALAASLAEQRGHAAAALADAVMAELPDLKLGEARFLVRTEIEPESRSAEGTDSAEFWVQTNPGTNPGPMMKVASGGELSRFLLALKVALADRGSAPTLVFDEIDTGVGGAVADAIGARLGRLADKVQVLSVTHAPQVAARANEHLLISKSGSAAGEFGGTRVRVMDSDERREEIARMLSGASITPEARAAADRLLAS